jgi:hypothetical protein
MQREATKTDMMMLTDSLLTRIVMSSLRGCSKSLFTCDRNWERSSFILWRWRGVSEKSAASEQEKNPDRRKRIASSANLNVMRYSNFTEKYSSVLKYRS